MHHLCPLEPSTLWIPLVGFFFFAPTIFDKFAFSRYDRHWWGSLAQFHISTFGLLWVHWPELISPKEVVLLNIVRCFFKKHIKHALVVPLCLSDSCRKIKKIRFELLTRGLIYIQYFCSPGFLFHLPIAKLKRVNNMEGFLFYVSTCLRAPVSKGLSQEKSFQMEI